MSKTISIGQLRQNPTAMLREVRAGATYTVTDRGEPVAEIAARRQQRWVPGSDVDALLRGLGADDDWAHEIAEDRVDTGMADPWARPE